jgi:hypothetical protein
MSDFLQPINKGPAVVTNAAMLRVVPALSCFQERIT